MKPPTVRGAAGLVEGASFWRARFIPSDAGLLGGYRIGDEAIAEWIERNL